MSYSEYQGILSLAGAITVLGTSFLTIRKIAKDTAKTRKEHAAEILHEAKEQDALIKAKLEARIESLKADLSSLKLSVEKDMEHIKETYTSEIKNLGEKIESLRSELRSQSAGIIELLSKLVDKQ